MKTMMPPCPSGMAHYQRATRLRRLLRRGSKPFAHPSSANGGAFLGDSIRCQTAIKGQVRISARAGQLFRLFAKRPERRDDFRELPNSLPHSQHRSIFAPVLRKRIPTGYSFEI
jgi:hypothetical protein